MNFEKCPSCNAKGERTKSHGFRYNHSNDCEMGKLKACPTDTIVIELLNRGVYGIYKCSKCGAISYCGSFPSQFSSWKAPYECPICWARLSATQTG